MWDQMQLFIRKVADQQVRAVIYFDGRIDEQIMRKAAKLSLRAEPVLGCRYVEGYFTARWERTPGAEEQAAFELLTTTHPEQDISRFLMQAIDPFKSPQVQVLIVRASNDTLCVSMDHPVGDAAGLKDYLYLLSSIYKSLATNPDYQPESNVKGSRSLWQVGGRLTLAQKARVLRQSLARRKPVTDWQLPLQRADNGDKFILTRKLSPDRFRTIRKYAGDHKATINDVILAGFFRALQRTIHPSASTSMRAFVTVDLRRYIPSRRAESI